MTSPSNNPQIDPRRLQANPWNTNVVSPENEHKIDESVKRFGMFKPILVRELEDGALQIIGGQHRVESAIRLGLKLVPLHNLGRIDDKTAKEIGIVDNGRYGADDTLRLAELLEGLGNADDLAMFMPYSDSDFASIFASTNISLDDLDLTDDGPASPSTAQSKAVQTHQIMRFKVPVDDVGKLTARIERTMKEQGFTDEDSLSNAGHALVHLLGDDA